jgi:hypothetical protein
VDLTSIMNQFQGQGSIFWIAAASIAAGATMLIVSGLLAVRRGFAQIRFAPLRFPRLSGRARGYRRAKPAQQATEVAATETGYTATGMAALGAHPAPPALNREKMVEFQGRLRSAAQNLEEIRGRLAESEEGPFFSGLKEGQEEVDYFFKAGIG